MSDKIIILVPAYEPDNNLINLVQNLSKEELDIIIIDDGSGKRYKSVFDMCKNKAKVISYNDNKGKGYALKTGLQYIKYSYQEPYIIVTMDCDGQHTIKDAKKLIKECSLNRDTMYLGKRLRSKKTPLRSRMGNAITRFVYRVTSGLDVYDTQTGLRAFSDELVDYLLKIEGDRFEYEMNILLKCAKDKVPIKEIEIETIYIDNNSKSHFNTFTDSYLIYKDILKNTLSKNKY